MAGLKVVCVLVLVSIAAAVASAASAPRAKHRGSEHKAKDDDNNGSIDRNKGRERTADSDRYKHFDQSTEDDTNKNKARNKSKDKTKDKHKDVSKKLENVSGVAVFLSTNGNNTEHKVRYITADEAERLFLQQTEEFLQHQQQIMEAFNSFNHASNIFMPDFMHRVFSKVNRPITFDPFEFNRH